MSLVLLASGLAATTVAIGWFAAERLSGTVHGDVDDAKVYAQEVRDKDGRGFLKLDGGVQEKHAVPVDKVALPPDASQVGRLSLAEDVGDDQPARAAGQDAEPMTVL